MEKRVQFLRLDPIMEHSVVVCDQEGSSEITKDWNGIDQVLLRNPHGASARVFIARMCCDI